MGSLGYSVLDNSASRGWDWAHIAGVPVAFVKFPVTCSWGPFDLGTVYDECKPATAADQVAAMKANFGPGMPQDAVDQAAEDYADYLNSIGYDQQVEALRDTIFTNPTNDPTGPMSWKNVAIWAAAGIAVLLLLTRSK